MLYDVIIITIILITLIIILIIVKNEKLSLDGRNHQ